MDISEPTDRFDEMPDFAARSLYDFALWDGDRLYFPEQSSPAISSVGLGPTSRFLMERALACITRQNYV